MSLVDLNGNPKAQSPWFSIGKTYQVLSFELDANDKWLARLIGDGLNGVALFSLEQFEIVTARVSPTWIVYWNNANLIELAPERWTRDGFWENIMTENRRPSRFSERSIGRS